MVMVGRRAASKKALIASFADPLLGRACDSHYPRLRSANSKPVLDKRK